MKTVSVRIGEGKAEKMDEAADQIAGLSRNSIVEMAVDLWFELEYPALLATRGEVRRKFKERHPVKVAS